EGIRRPEPTFELCGLWNEHSLWKKRGDHRIMYSCQSGLWNDWCFCIQETIPLRTAQQHQFIPCTRLRFGIQGPKVSGCKWKRSEIGRASCRERAKVQCSGRPSVRKNPISVVGRE